MSEADKSTAIRAALGQCFDPELGIDIVNLGLLYDVSVAGTDVTVTMTLTTPGCPLTSYFQRRVTELVRTVMPNSQVEVRFVFDPPWSPDKMTAVAKRTLTMLRG